MLLLMMVIVFTSICYAEDWVQEGNKALEARQYDLAISAYNKAIELDPQNIQAHNGRGNAYLEKGQLDDAIADFDKTITLNPKDTKPYFDRGKAYERKKLYKEAIENYRLLITNVPENKSQIDIAKNRIQALNSSPEATILCDLAIDLILQRDWDNSIKLFTEVIEIYPSYGDAYSGRAIVYSFKKQYINSIRDFSKAIELAKVDSFSIKCAYNNRAYVYVDMQKYDESIKDFQMLIKIDPVFNGEGYAQYKLAEVLELAGRKEEALEQYKIASEYQHLGKITARLNGDWDTYKGFEQNTP
jgi:tetratricopeptide (TPR) repeat protein